MRRAFTDASTALEAMVCCNADLVGREVAESRRAAAGWVGGPIDLVFIDAEHDFENCAQDILAWAPHVQGIVSGDDYRYAERGVWRAVRRKVGQTRLLSRAAETPKIGSGCCGQSTGQ